MCINYFDKKALIVGESNVRSRLNMKYPNPKEIGADRIVNAIGAIDEYEAPFIIIDFGTATTFCYIDDEQAYCGGVRSEEHTSELQSRGHLVCRHLLEKK